MTNPTSLACRLLIAGLTLVPVASFGQGAKSQPAKSQPAKSQPIKRRIPPKGIKIPAADREELVKKVNALYKQIDRRLPLHEDVEVYIKAVEFAVIHGEFYRKDDVKIARKLLELASARMAQLKQGSAPWTKATGLVVRGYRSLIDGSIQPYGLVIPKGLDRTKPVPLYVWLHGRGDKITDMHFIHRRLNRVGRIAPSNAIVVHPFGRHCMGFKWTGEVDVMDVVGEVKKYYNIDTRQVVLMGFSMGGAGCWHIGAHYPSYWVAMSPGAGFAETAQYNRLKKEDYPVSYEQKLWSIYDVPNYTRNLFNLPVTAYSGEKDKQIQAARVMEQAFVTERKKLEHIIGPGMGHSYHPKSLQQIMKKMAVAVEKRVPLLPKRVFLQTRTLRYNRAHWVEVLSLNEHWKDTRVDAEVKKLEVIVRTKNVRRLRLYHFSQLAGFKVTIDRQTLPVPTALKRPVLEKDGMKWKWVSWNPNQGLEKRPGLQGPMDDVWMSPFLVVVPSNTEAHPMVKSWVESQLKHFSQRWQALFRGRLPVKTDKQVTPVDMKRFHLVLWGDAKSNSLIAKLLPRMPIRWNDVLIQVGQKKFNSAHHVPLAVYPNPLEPTRYVLLNTGPTFREGHDRTNSLQNAKLPDWAVLDIRQPPNDVAAGKVAAADFFDEFWRVK